MYVQIITYTVTGMTESEWQEATKDGAPVIAAFPGLLGKTWIADPVANRYGGVYVWTDEGAALGYVNSDFVRGFAAIPAVSDIIVQGYSVWPEHSAVTRSAIAPTPTRS